MNFCLSAPEKSGASVNNANYWASWGPKIWIQNFDNKWIARHNIKGYRFREQRSHYHLDGAWHILCCLIEVCMACSYSAEGSLKFLSVFCLNISAKGSLRFVLNIPSSLNRISSSTAAVAPPFWPHSLCHRWKVRRTKRVDAMRLGTSWASSGGDPPKPLYNSGCSMATRWWVKAAGRGGYRSPTHWPAS